MNCSGEALTHLQWPWRPGDLIVVHDDIDLPLGRLRVRHDGGCGGHLGLESLGRVCGRDFDRVRLGVGRPPQGVDPAEYVLADFAQDELRTLAESVDRASLAVECLLTAGLAEAMNRFNMRRTVSCPEIQSEDHPEKN